jgi:hypothetical protein
MVFGGSEDFEPTIMINWWKAVAPFLVVGFTCVVQAQDSPAPSPDINEIEVIWREYWSHIARGDYIGVCKYVHSDRQCERSRKYPLREIEQRKVIAKYLLLCRPESPVVRISADVVDFSVRCPRRSAGEEDGADAGNRLRLDGDGKWKFGGV